MLDCSWRLSWLTIIITETVLISSHFFSRRKNAHFDKSGLETDSISVLFRGCIIRWYFCIHSMQWLGLGIDGSSFFVNEGREILFRLTIDINVLTFLFRIIEKIKYYIACLQFIIIPPKYTTQWSKIIEKKF